MERWLQALSNAVGYLCKEDVTIISVVVFTAIHRETVLGCLAKLFKSLPCCKCATDALWATLHDIFWWKCASLLWMFRLYVKSGMSKQQSWACTIYQVKMKPRGMQVSIAYTCSDAFWLERIRADSIKRVAASRVFSVPHVKMVAGCFN